MDTMYIYSFGGPMGGYGHMGGGFGMGLIGGILGLIIHLAFTIAVIMIVVWLFRFLFRKMEGLTMPTNGYVAPNAVSQKDTAIDVLRNRYAKGEVNTEEYKKMLAVLENKDIDIVENTKGE